MTGKKGRMVGKPKRMAKPIDTLLADIRELILSARRLTVRSVDTIQVLTSFEIGRRIVEHKQRGSARAEYGKQILRELAERLTTEFGRGFSRANLEYMRKFYLAYRDRLVGKSQMPSGKLTTRDKSQMPFDEDHFFVDLVFYNRLFRKFGRQFSQNQKELGYGG